MTEVHRRALKEGPDLCAGPDLSELPVRVPRDVAANLLTRHRFKISPRSLERAPLRWQRLNGKAHCLTADLFAWADEVVCASPPVMGGRRTPGGS